MSTPDHLPFSGYRVLDLTNVIAGPYCGHHLAMMGADVIKIESREGDLARRLGADRELNARNMGASFLALSPGKRAITLNLKSEGGKEIFKRLAATADVVLENFRPGVMDRLGVGYEVLRALRPGLVYCAISGFGQEGPWGGKAAYDQIVQGLSGAMAATGTQQSGPLRVGYPLSDTVAGINAAFGIAAALTQRARTEAAGQQPEAQFVDVSMLDATISIMGWATSNQLIAGQEPVLMGNDNFTASPSGSFATGDGLINVAANMQHQFETLARTLERPELIDDARFANPEARLVNREALKAEMERTLAGHGNAHWVEVLNGAGIPCGEVLSLREALELPPVQHRGSVREIHDVPDVAGPGQPGAIKVFTGGYKLSGGAPHIGAAPATLGQHNAQVLAELGYSEEEVAALAEEGVI